MRIPIRARASTLLCLGIGLLAAICAAMMYHEMTAPAGASALFLAGGLALTRAFAAPEDPSFPGALGSPAPGTTHRGSAGRSHSCRGPRRSALLTSQASRPRRPATRRTRGASSPRPVSC